MIEIIVCTSRYMGIVDLTMTVTSGMDAFPGSPSPQFVRWADMEKDGYNMELAFDFTRINEALQTSLDGGIASMGAPFC